MGYAQKLPPFVSAEDYLLLDERDSTELFDRRAKFEAYRRFASLASYVLVSPEQYMIEVFTRAAGWACTPETEAVRPMLSDVIELGTHGLKLAAAEVFEDVRFGDPT